MARPGLFASTAFFLCAAALTAPALAKAPKEPPPPPKPPLDLTIKLTEQGPEAKWEVRIENTSGRPAKVGDDMRFLWFEVVRPGKAKPASCKLPADMVPAAVPGVHFRTLAPKDVIVHRFDPRFYCFSPDKQTVLVPSAQVTPHYGFPRKTKTHWVKGKKTEEFLPDVAPFIGDPDDPSGDVGPKKEVIGDPVILDTRYGVWSGTPGEQPAPEDDEEPDEPLLQMVRGSDAKTERDVTAVIRVRNPSTHKLVIFMRRELLTFQVLTPHGQIACDAEPDERNPDQRAFRSAAPGSSISLTSRLVELCERGTFAEPALYLVKAELAAPAKGEEYGLDAYTGTLKSPVPATVRVRHAVEIVQNRPTTPGAAQPAMPGQPPQMQQPMPVPQPMPAPPPPQ